MIRDEDIDLLRLESETATTPTRRAWAKRLVDRIERLEGLESARNQLTHSMTWPTTAPSNEHAADSDADPVHPSPGPGHGN